MTKPAGDGVEELMANFGLRLTDEQWAEQDRKVADAKAAEERKYPPPTVEEQHRHYQRYGWPLRAIEVAWSADATRPALERIAQWDHGEESVLVLSGTPGCGKTVAAAWWAIESGLHPTFLRATTFAASSRYDRETRDEWFGSRALVLDDLGSEYLDAKGSFLVDLDELVDVFYGYKRPLLITTNCTAEEFKSRYGARVVDRIRECGTWASIAGGSLRRKP